MVEGGGLGKGEGVVMMVGNRRGWTSHFSQIYLQLKSELKFQSFPFYFIKNLSKV